MQEAQPLGQNLSRKKINAGSVAARPGKTGNQTQLDGILGDAEDDRDRGGSGFGGVGTSGEAGCSDHGHATADEVSHERGRAVVLAVEPVVLHGHVLALDVAGVVEGLPERSAAVRGFLGRLAADEPNHWHRRLLRVCRERPRRRRAAEKRDEIAASHDVQPPAIVPT